MGDRNRILNSIVGRTGNDINDTPLHNHENYEILNNAIRGAFASSTTPAIVGAYKQKEKEWKKVLTAIQNGVTKTLSFDFEDNNRHGPPLGRNNGCDMTSAEDAAEMISYLPAGLEELDIINCPQHGPIVFMALMDWMENESINLRRLGILNSSIGRSSSSSSLLLGIKECGERLARYLVREDCQIDNLGLNSKEVIYL